MRVHYERKSAGVTVDHEKKRWANTMRKRHGVNVHHQKESDGVKVHHEKDR